MYVFVIANRTTGEIIHCMTDSGSGEKFEQMVAENRMPITLDGGWDDTICFNAEIRSPDVPVDAIPKAKDFRESYRVFPDGATGKDVLTKCIVAKRAVKGKTNEIDGTIVDDPSKYDEAVAASKAKEVK